ncbi:MAG: hypothetical protein KatS3mg050_3297 [Litorilinea sp.]|nr:MAG: hypothetical protein KatS3mg050_3297 [Litorilinea sp.]
MADRYQLIARKQEVRRQIERLQRELEALRAQPGRGQQRRVARLEGELERLMAEEYQLRMAIDRSPG